MTNDNSVAAALRDFALQLRDASTVEDVGQALMPVCGLFKFSNLLISDTTKAMTDPDKVLIFSARSLSDVKSYVQRQPIASNPVLQLAWAAPEPMSLTEIRNQLNFETRDLWKWLPPWVRNWEGLSINVHLDHRTVWNLSFSGAHPDAGANARSVLVVASQMACERLQEIERSEAPAARLSPREAEALRLTASGSSDSEIGRRMGIAARTVRFHIDNAKEKLGVTTRAQAVLKMLRAQRDE